MCISLDYPKIRYDECARCGVKLTEQTKVRFSYNEFLCKKCAEEIKV